MRGRNGYVLAPRSVIEGKEYRRLAGSEVPGPLPEWIRDRLNAATERKPVKIAPEFLESLDQSVNVGRARNWLTLTNPETESGYVIACKLMDAGLSPDKAAEVFGEWSDKLAWPWDPDDVATKCRNAWEYRQNRGSAPLALDGRPTDEKFDFGTEINNAPLPALTPSGGPKKPNRFLTRAEQLALPQPTWAIAGLIPDDADVQIVAPSQFLKSFLAIELAGALSTGIAAFGSYAITRPGKIFYCAEEGVRS